MNYSDKFVKSLKQIFDILVKNPDEMDKVKSMFSFRHAFIEKKTPNTDNIEAHQIND